MSDRYTRRDVLKSTAAIGAGLWLGGSASAFADGPNEKLNIALIGVGGRGGDNLRGVSSQNIVALCDVDEKRAGKAFEKHSKAKKYHDFRRMLDEMDKQIDAVVVSTPDHTHFHPSMMAMNRGKHLYCEKPMAHTVWETREMTKLAAKKKVATQLGVQRHTIPNMHRVVELVKSGAIGEVREVHSWVGGSRGMPKVPKPTDTPPIPKTLKTWDLWLGPIEGYTYHPTYCPYGWRFWWDFGTGETGNWGCHILDIPYWALDLKYPTRVDASGPPVHAKTTPKSMTTSFDFAATSSRPAVKLHWYHSAQAPPAVKKHIATVKGFKPRGANNLFVGSKGALLCGFSMRKLLVDGKAIDPPATEKTVPDSPGFYREWFTACKGGAPATCHFGYSGPMTETVLLGNTAYRAGGGFDWNAENLRATGNDKAEHYLRPHFRKGWEV